MDLYNEEIFLLRKQNELLLKRLKYVYKKAFYKKIIIYIFYQFFFFSFLDNNFEDGFEYKSILRKRSTSSTSSITNSRKSSLIIDVSLNLFVFKKNLIIIII